jgi:methionyl aminopeptidase
MIQPKTTEDIVLLREGGAILAHILKELEKATVPGVTSLDLENLARKLTAEAGAVPAFLGYKPHGATRAYPAALCLSVNDVVVHGIPNEQPFVIKAGDLVTLDMGISYKHRIVDSAITVAAGGDASLVDDEKGRKLLQAGKECLDAAIEACKNWPTDFPGGIKTGDIGNAIEKALDFYTKKYKFHAADGLGGHGVGFSVHEDPFVPNFGKPGQGPALKPGVVIAIEPIINEGTENILLEDDAYTIKTEDGKRSVHFEHTLVITEDGAEVLTERR